MEKESKERASPKEEYEAKAARHSKECDDVADSKSSDNEEEEAQEKWDLEVEKEWTSKLKHPTNTGSIQRAMDPRGRLISEGNHMNMRCGETGKLMWQQEKFTKEMYEREQRAIVPREILNCNSVSREINFTSIEEIHNFRLEQRVYFHGKCLEEWLFTFGYVMPNSTNSWQQTIEAAGPENMLSPEHISGKITIETGFYDADILISKTVFRIYYE
ncbi:cGMP 3',5'-cyclic phosphodiesterase subunit delta [Thraustotheca clavata]|uniref:cGMP 3',5'-cyclic phosphodiesterase subunit delta n=1 Tax=Thraustotheca clavata TaxID=74557 RepID=A0A1W0AAS2_9STRA|nr:cGMP 3',5'-cyclic phosphodiesterase subunit delta [Thraustotheca clavata]